MALRKAKCLNCGANVKVNDGEKTGVCLHCGASYVTEDIIVKSSWNSVGSNSTIGNSISSDFRRGGCRHPVLHGEDRSSGRSTRIRAPGGFRIFRDASAHRATPRR